MSQKNSGILRYRCQEGLDPGEGFPPLIVGDVAFVVIPLDVLSVAQPDQDGQTFGASPGHLAVPPAAPFPGSAAATGDPVTQSTPTPGSRDVGRLPRGTKVRAWFETEAVTGNKAALVTVKTRVIESALVGGTPLAVTGTEQFLSVIQVAVQAFTPVPGDEVAGHLYVDVQHSYLDLSGSSGQDQDGTVVPP